MQNSQIAERIKKTCKEQHVSVSALLQDCNLTKSFIYDLEKRNTSPSCDKIAKISEYLNCSIEYILCLSDNQNKNSSSPERDELLKDPRVLDLINALLSIPPDQRDRFLDELDKQLKLNTIPKDEQ